MTNEAIAEHLVYLVEQYKISVDRTYDTEFIDLTTPNVDAMEMKHKLLATKLVNSIKATLENRKENNDEI